MRQHLKLIGITILLIGILKISLGQVIPASQTQVNASVNTAFLPGPYTAGIPLSFVRTWVPMGKFTDPNLVLSATYLDVQQSTNYFDGLGRPLQSVQRQVSPIGNDMVSMHTYDVYDREVYHYLPYTQTNANTSDGLFKMDPFGSQKTFYQTDYKDANAQVMNPGEQFYYSQTTYESSPLNKTILQMPQGNNWVGNNTGVSQTYMVNGTTDLVQIWNITSNPLQYVGNDETVNIPVSAGSYPAGTLYKLITKDERGKVVVEYKDMEGQTILKKVQLLDAIPADYSGYDGFLCTYYIYDQLHQLRFVIQPKGVDLIKANWVISGNNSLINELCFRYEYDSRGRMSAKKVPGAGWVYMIYDSRDRLVFSQDANMRAKNQWMTSLYDGLNRPTETGITVYSSTPSSLQSSVTTATSTSGTPNNSLQLDVIVTSLQATGVTTQAMRSITLDVGFSSTDNGTYTAQINPGPAGSDGDSYVIDGAIVNKYPVPSGASFISLTQTYYDTYDWATKTYTTAYNSYLVPDANRNSEGTVSSSSVQIRGLVTGTRVRSMDDLNQLGNGKWISTTLFYDDKARSIQSSVDNYVGGTDVVSNLFDFTGKVLSNYVSHQNPLANTNVTVNSTMLYDANGRLLKIWKTLNNDNTKKALITNNQYDALGQLMHKELGNQRNSDGTYNSLPVEKLDYTYNIRGWLRGINSGFAHPELNGGSLQQDRYFGMELDYDWGFSQNQLNGNVGGIRWKSKGDGEQRAYGFAYDNVNRLLKADFTQNDGGWGITAGMDFTVGGSHDINNDLLKDYKIKYDANGNITEMWQKGWSLTTSDWIDQLQYNYQTNSNKLQNVIDSKNDVNTKLGDFRSSQTYMTSLGNNKTASANDYNYDVNGNQTQDLNKDISTGGITYNHLNLPYIITTTKGTIQYVYDATGNKLKKIVKDNSVNPVKVTTTLYLFGVYENNILQYLPQEEGRIRPTLDVNNSITGYVYDYFIKDHLGNVRMTLTD
ncbi:MAG: DUF6443 domain-containing protein, partial [Flavisolibacter sp.]